MRAHRKKFNNIQESMFTEKRYSEMQYHFFNEETVQKAEVKVGQWNQNYSCSVIGFRLIPYLFR